MTKKDYAWADGATLDDHTRQKHKVLREYFFQYIAVRCQLPQMERFRLAVVDGFSGGGRYKGGEPGSPIILIEELRSAFDAINTHRKAQGLGEIEIECLFVLNDESQAAIELLKTHVAPLQAEIRDTRPKLHLRFEYSIDTFERSYPAMKALVERGRFRSALFNLDQCGHAHVERRTLVDIMRSFPAAEIFYTFAIQALIAFLEKDASQLGRFDLSKGQLADLQQPMSKQDWLGLAERVVFEAFQGVAPFNSPFSIHNPEGWRYWLIHFANSHRARQVYNNVLHQTGASQAHFGRSGLNMLSYNPNEEGALYLFDVTGRQVAKDQLMEDIPRVISDSGNAILVAEFYEGIYNTTAAHTDDIHSAIIENPDLQVVTEAGGERRKANTIAVSDVIKLKVQRSLFPMFRVKDNKGGEG